MAVYSCDSLNEMSGVELQDQLRRGDVITGLYPKGTMGLSSFTGSPYDTIGSEGTKVVIGGAGKWNNVVSGPITAKVLAVRSPSLVVTIRKLR